MIISAHDQRAVDAVEAVRAGDVDGLKKLLADNPELATARIRGGHGGSGAEGPATRTLLHVATDWPGHFPGGPAIVGVLVEAGADMNAPFTGAHAETPLHWAASSDDVAVLDALLDAGADIEASGAVVGGGTPLDDATAFGQWRTARRLVERGARTTLFNAATLGMLDRVEELTAAGDVSPDEITGAFWGACHGGQLATAEHLLAVGADRDWVGWDNSTPLDVATRAEATQVVDWLRAQGAHTAAELAPKPDGGAGTAG